MFVLVAEEADDGAPPPSMRKFFICLSKLPLSGVRWDARQHANLQASPRGRSADIRRRYVSGTHTYPEHYPRPTASRPKRTSSSFVWPR